MSSQPDNQPGSADKRPPDPASTRSTAPHPRPPLPPEPPPPVVSGSVGGDVAARDVNKNYTADRDVVGRDVISNTTNTNVGFSAAAVQRLVVSVGVLVFVTALCFFSGGVVVGGAALAALKRPVDSNSAAAAQRFADGLQALRALPPGQPFNFTFTEEEISSYFRLIAAPSLPGHITDGRVRLLDNGQLVIGGSAGSLAGARFAATFAWQDEPGEPLRLTGAALRALPGDSAFGWVAVPGFALGSVTGELNRQFGGVQFTDVQSVGHDENQPAWTVTVVGQ